MNTKLILLAVCYRHHWYLRRGRISPARGNLSLLANRKEGRKEETRCGRISQIKGCATASVIECYALRRQRARYSLVDRRWLIHLTWRFVTRLEYLEEKIKRNWKKKKSRNAVLYSITYVESRKRDQNFHLRRYASARTVVGCSRHASITVLRVFR